MARPKKLRIYYTTNFDKLSISINVSEESVILIKERMNKRCVTQAAIVRECGISRSCLSKFLHHPRHHIRINSLKAILEFLELDTILEKYIPEDERDSENNEDDDWDFT